MPSLTVEKNTFRLLTIIFNIYRPETNKKKKKKKECLSKNKFNKDVHS